jgi:nicotinamide mononucleotide transporter
VGRSITLSSSRSSRRPGPLPLAGYAGCAALTAALLAGFAARRLPFGWQETLGFIAGVWGVWLQVREIHWNWPVQLVSSGVYVIVFFQARLFADTTLNVLYVALYALGWYWWLRGGTNRSRLDIGRVGWRLAAVLAGVAVLGTAGMAVLLVTVHDSSPVLDALTTVTSLIALFLMARKLFEAWWVWIAVNLVYVGLYLTRDLYLTALLYAIFAALSVVGLQQWRRLLAARPPREMAAG